MAQEVPIDLTGDDISAASLLDSSLADLIASAQGDLSTLQRLKDFAVNLKNAAQNTIAHSTKCSIENCVGGAHLTAADFERCECQKFRVCSDCRNGRDEDSQKDSQNESFETVDDDYLEENYEVQKCVGGCDLLLCEECEHNTCEYCNKKICKDCTLTSLCGYTKYCEDCKDDFDCPDCDVCMGYAPPPAKYGRYW